MQGILKNEAVALLKQQATAIFLPLMNLALKNDSLALILITK